MNNTLVHEMCVREQKSASEIRMNGGKKEAGSVRSVVRRVERGESGGGGKGSNRHSLST
jgi:hypothetical protein